MRRLMLLLALAMVSAAGVWLAVRGGSSDANARVSSLLPRETLVFAHVPDFSRAREQWRQTDIYRLWREPVVQEFLQKPLAGMSQRDSTEARLQELERLGVRDVFVALPAVQGDHPAIVGGFRFKGSKADAEKLVSGWRERMLPGGGHETVQHQRHRIEVLRGGRATLATVFNDNWFFAANDVAALTALLDRTNSKTADAATSLGADETFAAALKPMPAGYAGFAFARPQELASRLAHRLPQDGNHARRFGVLQQARSISGATAFDNGKVRDVLFVAMPQANAGAELTRNSLALATNETFLYLAALLTFPDEPGSPNNAVAVPGAGLASAVQRVITQLGASGITAEDWNSAFGSEVGVVGDWPANARLPALLASLPVKDRAKADELVGAITAAATEGGGWAVSERNGVRYYSQPAANPLIPIAPTVAVARDRVVLGVDTASVTAALQRAASGGESALAASAGFRAAEGSVQAPRQSFTYLDTALLYTRLDAALRPMLIMSAAFMPAIAQAVDLSKVPPPEVITRHLSPIVISQRYDEGYITESVGPVSIYQAAIGMAAATGAGARWYQQNVGSASTTATFPTATPAAASPTPGSTP